MVDAESRDLKCGQRSPETCAVDLQESLIYKLLSCVGLPPACFIKMRVLWTNCIFMLVCCCGSGFGSPNRCDEVRKVFQLRQIGPYKLLSVSPRPGTLEFRFKIKQQCVLLSLDGWMDTCSQMLIMSDFLLLYLHFHSNQSVNVSTNRVKEICLRNYATQWDINGDVVLNLSFSSFLKYSL